jgi:hypothetical protein
LARHNGSAGACSSAGQSSCLLSSRSQVRILPGAPTETPLAKTAKTSLTPTVDTNSRRFMLSRAAPAELAADLPERFAVSLLVLVGVDH